MATTNTVSSLQRIVYINVFVRDLDVSRAFYSEALGLHVIEDHEDSITYDCGQVMLVLKRASDYGIETPVERDGSADIVFLVDDLVTVRAALEERGVEFNPTLWYEPGGMADLYDPDLHWLTLYQPTEMALGWPSADRIRAVLKVRENGANGAAPLRPEPRGKPARVGLGGAEIIYLFTFIEDADATEAFYHGQLGLESLEGGPCSQTSSGDVNGVVKYDTGGMMLATHFIEPERPQEKVDEHACPPKIIDLQRLKSVTVSFAVESVEEAVRGLRQAGVKFSGPVVTTDRGYEISFEDPTGHVAHLLQPNREALARPTGVKLRQILDTPLEA